MYLQQEMSVTGSGCCLVSKDIKNIKCSLNTFSSTASVSERVERLETMSPPFTFPHRQTDCPTT